MGIMVEKIREFWHDQIPMWVPIILTIVGTAFWLGQQQQSIIDRLTNVEKQVQHMQDYLYQHHDKTSSDSLIPGVSSFQAPPQVAGGDGNAHY